MPAAPSDSIVRLAVDPAQQRGRPFLLLLDEGVNRVEADGRTVRRTRQVYQILDQSVVRGLSERAFTYAKSHQTLTIDWIRVLKPGGEVLSNKPAQEQESDVAAQMSNPVYQEQRVRRVSLAGVAVGTILDIQFTLEERAPPRAGDFLFGWSVNNQYPIARSRFTIDVPEGYTPRIVERNLTFRRTESVAGGRRTYTWAANDVAPYRTEPFAADSNGVAMFVGITSPGTWNDIARWYDGLARDRYALTPVVAQRIDSLVRASGARTRLDTIRAIHRWVAQDVRYVSVSLGIGGYQPRTPAEVLAAGFGDCKDKATLFVAALRRYRIAGQPGAARSRPASRIRRCRRSSSSITPSPRCRRAAAGHSPTSPPSTSRTAPSPMRIRASSVLSCCRTVARRRSASRRFRADVERYVDAHLAHARHDGARGGARGGGQRVAVRRSPCARPSACRSTRPVGGGWRRRRWRSDCSPAMPPSTRW